jgi:flagellin-specific chaperone FliS
MQNATAVAVSENEAGSSPAAGVSERHDRIPCRRALAAANSYRNDEFASLTPVRVVDKLYSIAILACKKKDTSLAQKAISELIVGLNFEHEEISTGLFRLYEYSKECIRKGNTNEAVRVLEELRSTWAQAFHL